MGDNQKIVIDLLKNLVGQANILTIPRAFIDLTGDVKAALFLSQCVYWSGRSGQEDGVFYKTYQQWQEEIALSRYEIDQVRKRVKRWVKTELRTIGNIPILHYRVEMDALVNDLLLRYSPESRDVQTLDSQMHLLETDKCICQKPTNAFVENSQMHLLETDKCLNKVLTEITTETTTKTTTEINSSIGFASSKPETAHKSKSNAASGAAADKGNNGALPADIRDKLHALGWRGSQADVEAAWREDAERVRQWLWFAAKHNWSGALLRTALRSKGEYPPELDPSSLQSRRRYIEGDYAEFVEH